MTFINTKKCETENYKLNQAIALILTICKQEAKIIEWLPFLVHYYFHLEYQLQLET